MNVVSFLMIVLLGVSLISLSFLVAEQLKEMHSRVTARESLKEITSYIASVVVDAYEQAQKSSLKSDVKPIVNLSIELPKKVGGERYYIQFGGRYYTITGIASLGNSQSIGTGDVFVGVDKVVGSTESGLSQAYASLPYVLMGGGIIDSYTNEHYIAIFRPENPEIEAIASYNNISSSNSTTITLVY